MRRSGLLVLSLFIALPAAAEIYQWKDAEGRVNYSDVPPSKGEMRTLRGGDPIASPPAAASEAAPKPKSIAERELEFRQRLAEKGEAQAKAEKESQEAAQRQRTCEQARNQLVALKSGQRIAIFDSKGERSYLDDAGRADEITRTEKLIADACK